jgi:hypothetical protein
MKHVGIPPAKRALHKQAQAFGAAGRFQDDAGLAGRQGETGP